MPMDEDAMFKALLKNKPAPKQPVANEIKQAPVQPAKPPQSSRMPAKGSEDAMFKALLHNKPAAQKPQVRVEPKPEPMQPQAAQVQQEPVVITQVSPPPVITIEPVVDSINNLAANVNQLQSLMKTTVLPVIILILLVGIGILVKIQ